MKTININSKEFYYGCNISDLKVLRIAEEDTVASGVYLTSDKKVAVGYAKRRARYRGGIPTIYTVIVSKTKFVDLTDKNTLQKIMNEFLEILKKQKSIAKQWFQSETVQNSIDEINRGNYHPGNIREITYSHTKLFTRYLISLNIDGLVCLEGGEGEDIGNHDSWVVFDPKKVKISKEEIVN